LTESRRPSYSGDTSSARRHGCLVLPVAGLAVGLLAGVASSTARPAAPAAIDPLLARDLDRYVAEPSLHVGSLLRVARNRRRALPPGYLLTLGDALLRAGKPSAARTVFRGVLAYDVDTETAGWAHFGLGWIALARGDQSGARSHYETIVAGGWGVLSARVHLALIAAASGRGREAAATLDEIAASPEAWDALRLLCRAGAGYARHWAGDYRAAAVTFEVTALEFPTSRLVDDALYGAAWSAYRAGDRETGLRGLRRLAESRGAAPISPHADQLVDLDPAAIFREGLRRYRGTGIGRSDDQMLTLIDLDAAPLARAALVRLTAAGSETVPVRAVPSDARQPGRKSAEPPVTPGRSRGSDGVDADRSRWLGPLGVAVLILLSVLTWRVAAPRARRSWR